MQLTIANVNSRYAVAVVAGEKVAKASAALRFAVLWRLVAAITAVGVTIAVPSGWNAPVVWATEAVGWASALRAV